MGCCRLPWWLKAEFKTRRILLILCLVELPMTIAALALFGIADPDTYRDKLWKEGYRLGLSSDPVLILYQYANYQTPTPPAPWAQFTTDWNVVISVLSMFCLLCKTFLYIMHILPPLLSAIVHAILIVLYSLSIYWQSGKDTLDKTQTFPHPWPLAHGCNDPAITPALVSACRQFQASFAIAVLLCSLFAVDFFYSVAVALPTRERRRIILEEEAAAAEYSDDDDSSIAPDDEYGQDRKYEYEHELEPLPSHKAWPLPNEAKAPLTPRSLALQTLETHSRNRDLPLRHHISMGDEVFHAQ